MNSRDFRVTHSGPTPRKQASGTTQVSIDRSGKRPDNFGTKPIERVQSAYQRLEIMRHPIYGNQLYIDDDLQISACDHAYNTAMTAPLIAEKDCRRIVILGGGDGGVLNELFRAANARGLALERVTLIDIDPDVVRLARRYLGAISGNAFDHPKAEVISGDAFAYIRRARDLDAIVYDLTMDPVREDQSRDAFIAEVVAQMAKALRPGGVLSMQAGGIYDGELIARIRDVVEQSFTDVIEQKVLVPSFEELWTFIAARKPPLSQ